MQTFLPYANFSKSASCLDYRRLGKQRIETKQILMTLTGQSTAWSNHPAVSMWKGYEGALCIYGIIMCEEWIRRGYKDTTLEWFEQNRPSNYDDMPPWLGREEFHASHRSNLLRKDPEWYGKFGWKETDDLPYWWPTKEM